MIRRVYHFGDCSVDVAARELRQGGQRVPLSPPVFDCIAYLLEHRDRAVGRDELVAAVWGKVSVSENLVGKTLVKARRALGDSGAQQDVILTVPRFGFHWVAAVQVEDIEADAAPPEVPTAVISAPEKAAPLPPAPAPARGSARRLRIGIGIVLLVLCAALAEWAVRRNAAPPPDAARTAASADEVRIAVLPVIVDAGADDSWLRLGLMDLIAQRLQLAGVNVVSSDAIVRVVGDGTHADAGDAALRAATGARFLVAAAARRAGADWTIKAVLHDVDGSERDIEARAADAVTVGREAADRLLLLLGRRLPEESDRATGLSLAEASQRVDAALLVNDFAAARRAIVAATAADQAAPELQLRRSEIDYRLGRSQQARERLAGLLPGLSAETAPVLRARALTGLGAIALKQNQPDAAVAPLDEAIALLEGRNEPSAIGHAHTGRGIAHAMRGEYAAAAADFARARIAFELAGNAHAAARVDLNEGAMASLRDRPAEALPLFERAAQRFARLDAPTDLINTLGNEVDARLALLQPAAALAASERMMPLLERIENPIERRIFLVLRARALEAVGRITEARALLGDLLQAASPERETTTLGEARALQAAMDLAAGQAATAVALARQAIDALDGAEYAHARAEAWRVLVRALLQRGETAAAADESARFGAWAQGARRGSVLALARLAEAERTSAQQDPIAADALFRGAAQVADEAGVPRDAAAAAVAYAQALIAAGDLPRASEVAGQLARWADRDFASALVQVRLYQALGQREAWRTSLARARELAGERRIGADLQREPDATLLGAEPPVADALP